MLRVKDRKDQREASARYRLARQPTRDMPGLIALVIVILATIVFLLLVVMYPGVFQ